MMADGENVWACQAVMQMAIWRAGDGLCWLCWQHAGHIPAIEEEPPQDVCGASGGSAAASPGLVHEQRDLLMPEEP